MTKTIANWLNVNENGKPKENNPPQPRTFYLDDTLKNDPTQVCPNCESNEIDTINTHNVDGIDYKCDSCKFRYEIVYFTKRDEIGH